MRIIITADLHNGYAGKLDDCIWSMDIIRRYANKDDIQDIFVCGDLFHDRVSLGINILNAVYDQLKLCKNDGQTWHCFPGNHDMFLKNSWECNSLHIFRDTIKIYEDITQFKLGNRNFHVLPFVHYEARYMETLKQIEKQKTDILLTHIGVNGATLNECFLLKNWSVVTFEETKFNLILAGHFHCHQQIGKVVYPGTPIPFRFDEGVVDHGFIVLDLDNNEWEFVKTFEIAKDFKDECPPDYLTIIDQDLKEWVGLVTGNHVRIQLTRDYTNNELTDIRTALKDKKNARSVSWLLPKKEIDEATVLQNQLTKVSTPEATFESWLTIDKPKNLSLEALRGIHKQILLEAEERVVAEVDDDS